MRPTPNPAKKRPAKKMGMAVAAVWRITPRLNTQVEAIKLHLRPMLSAMRGEARAPKKVPADRMETMADSWDGDTSGWLSVLI
jgi:hypothetical protein